MAKQRGMIHLVSREYKLPLVVAECIETILMPQVIAVRIAIDDDAGRSRMLRKLEGDYSGQEFRFVAMN